jgi:ribonuclease D
VSANTAECETVYIDNAGRLAEFCKGLAGAKRIAVDTEFVGEKYYYPRLEVVQLRGEDGPVGIVDAQAISDWSPLAALLADPAILKLFHAADQDLDILGRSAGVRTAPVFDTQLAASMLGFGAQISLVNLVRAIVDVELSGKQTTSDWSHRPLTAEQISYAAADVLHLHAIQAQQAAELKSRGRDGWFLDEQAQRLEGSGYTEQEPMDAWRRVKDWASLSGRDLAVLRELAALRETRARERNVPRKLVLTDESLVELARFQPDTIDKMTKLRRINVGQANRLFTEIREATRRGKLLPREEWPCKPASEKVDIPTGLVELCQALLRTEAENHGVAPTILATTSDLTQVIIERAALDTLDNPLLKGWRRELVGERLARLLRGQVQVVVGTDGGLIFEDR